MPSAMRATAMAAAFASAAAFSAAPAAPRTGVLALRAQEPQVHHSRRGMLATFGVGVLAAPALAGAEKARTGLSSKFTGEYTDPQHPGCQRSIKVTGNAMDPSGRKSRKPAAVIKGTDNEDGGACEAGSEAEPWRLQATLTEDQSKIMVDFSPKGGPKDVVGKWSDGGIVFPDGNKWSKIQEEVTTLVGKIQ